MKQTQTSTQGPHVVAHRGWWWVSKEASVTTNVSHYLTGDRLLVFNILMTSFLVTELR